MTKAREIIVDALRKCRVVAIDEPATDDMVQAGYRELTRMLRSWQNKGYHLWLTSSVSLTMTTAATYALASRPRRILNVNRRVSGIDTPLGVMTRNEYDTLPNKTSAGTPVAFHYDRQRNAGTLYVWPVPNAVSGETLEVTYEREIDGATTAIDDLDVPGEWEAAVVYSLADRLADEYDTSDTKLMARAEEELRVALAADREGSLFWTAACD